MSLPRALTLVITSVLIFAICWFTISLMTSSFRAISSGVILVILAGCFITMAATDTRALARAVVGIGASAFAAPLAGIQAMNNDFIFSVFDEGTPENAFLHYDATLEIALWVVGIGIAVGLVLMIAGGIAHSKTHVPK